MNPSALRAFVVEKRGSLIKFNKELLYVLAAKLCYPIVSYVPLFFGKLCEVIVVGISEVRVGAVDST
jgi:hypothetical protein